MIKKKIKNWLFNPIVFLQLLSSAIKKKFIPNYERKAINFFKSKDIYKYFISGNNSEIKPDYIDLKIIFELNTSRKPKCVLEFGVGFSTICIALALKENEIKYGYTLSVVKPFNIEGKTVSSSAIRKLLKAGDIVSVNSYLGRNKRSKASLSTVLTR